MKRYKVLRTTFKDSWTGKWFLGIQWEVMKIFIPFLFTKLIMFLMSSQRIIQSLKPCGKIWIRLHPKSCTSPKGYIYPFYKWLVLDFIKDRYQLRSWIKIFPVINNFYSLKLPKLLEIPRTFTLYYFYSIYLLFHSNSEQSLEDIFFFKPILLF